MQNTSTNKPHLGFYISAFGTVLILLWLGLYKFTAIEAEAIFPLIENHPLSFWMYDVFSVQTVSNLVGIIEIIVAILIIIGLKNKLAAKMASISIIGMFLMTLSYLFTTPNAINFVNGAPAFNRFLTADFFILKDIMYLGFGVSLYNYACKK